MKNSATNPTKRPGKPPKRVPEGPKPPNGLSREAKTWWRTIVLEWDLDESALLILESALECFDRQREAQAILAKDGLIQTDRFNQKKAHPATLIERDAKSAMLRHLAALHLDLEPLNAGPGRPGGVTNAV